MTVIAADRPLPYLPIRILDVSPHRSPIRRPAAPSAGATPRRRRIVAGSLAVLAIGAILAANVGAAPVGSDGSTGFRLGPGHAMPLGLAPSLGGDSSTDVRMAPGHAMPPSLSR
jgi:hypothetical protein